MLGYSLMQCQFKWVKWKLFSYLVSVWVRARSRCIVCTASTTLDGLFQPLNRTCAFYKHIIFTLMHNLWNETNALYTQHIIVGLIQNVAHNTRLFLQPYRKKRAENTKPEKKKTPHLFDILDPNEEAKWKELRESVVSERDRNGKYSAARGKCSEEIKNTPKQKHIWFAYS